jgi:hypothetical protein
MPLTILDEPIIAEGQSLSEGLDMTGKTLKRITMPAAWDGAALTFQISTDGLFYNDLYLADGREVKAMVVPGAAVIVSEFFADAYNFMKFRSGTAADPVMQTERRQFAVAVEA